MKHAKIPYLVVPLVAIAVVSLVLIGAATNGADKAEEQRRRDVILRKAKDNCEVRGGDWTVAYGRKGAIAWQGCEIWGSV